MPVSARRLPRFEPPLNLDGAAPRPLATPLGEGRTRRFLAQLSENDAPPRDTLQATDFLQAAIAFAESFAAAIDGHEIKVAVTDCETGERQCFALSL